MTLPDTEKVVQELNRRFAAPLPEFYQRRIVFWYDTDRDFEEQVQNGEIRLLDAKIVMLKEDNTFVIKKLLSHDDLTSDFCVYCPLTYPDEENWLLPIQLYSEAFRADLISLWLEEMKVPNTAMFRNVAKQYRTFFKTKEHRMKVAKLPTQISKPVQLYKAVMAVLCGVRKTEPGLLIRTVLCKGVDQDQNTIYQAMVKYGIDSIFWQMVGQVAGYREEKPNLRRLACHILLTAASYTLQKDTLAGLEGFISFPHQSYCYDFMSEWMRVGEKQELYNLSREIERELHLYPRFKQLPLENLIDTEIFPCIDDCILHRLMSDIIANTMDVKLIMQTVEKRRTFIWYAQTQPFYEGLLAVAQMQKFYLGHSAGFHTVEPAKVWQEYTKDYYQMDTQYRLFHTAFGKALNCSSPALDDLFKQVADTIEGLYANWFLDNLGSNWARVAADNLKDYGKILEIPQQEDFYRTYVQPAHSRVFVIISDALRYEVATELAEALRRETQAEVKLSSCEGIFPTVTKFGMAALLPHEKLTTVSRTNGSLGVLADGQSTEANYRETILKAVNTASVALKYKDIIRMKRAERNALVKGKEVVYIYHDKIDETSHTDEALVFASCADAMEEIKNLIRIIVNGFGGTKILITSDHGFIYTYKPLTEEAKIDKTTSVAEEIEVDRRYLITEKGVKPEYLLPVKFLDGSQYDAFAPIGNTRLKKKGGGLNFVHGGISLQEMVVPVIDYHYLRNDNKKYKQHKEKYDTQPVTLTLLSATHKISNMIFSLNFYQKEAVGDNRKAATYLLYFEDGEGTRVSDSQRIVADKTSVSNQERTFRVNFNLKSRKYSNKERYYLVIADESGLQLPQRETFQIDIAFAIDDFDFSE